MEKNKFFDYRKVESQLTVSEFIEREKALRGLGMQERAVMFLFISYGGLLLATVVIIFLQGFKVYGFQLETSLLRWLGGATVGEVAGLALLVYKALFKSE